jgi:thiol-disulfide isomerase/thioredoxin
MKRFSFVSIVSVLMFFCTTTLSAQGKAYNIEIKVNGLAEENIILGHYLGKSMYPDDTATIDKHGYGVFSGSKKLVQGLYILYFPNGSYFEIIMGEDQHFSLETDTSNYVKNLKVIGSPDNEIFIDFQHYMLGKRLAANKLQARLTDSLDEKEKKKIQNELTDLGKEHIAKVNSINEKHPDLFVSTFLKATVDIEVPETLQDSVIKRYQYYKAHYFDNFDLSDVRLLYTPLYEDKLNYYLDKVVLQMPDSLIPEIDMVVEKSRSDSALYRFVLITLFNKYGKSQYMGMDAVQVHIAEKYYITDSWWSDQKFINELKERVAILSPLLIGKVAPNVQLRYVPSEHFIQAANDTALKRFPHAGSFFSISDIDADFTVLIFWEATCSHCKKVVPDLYRIYQDTLKAMNVKVIAVSTLFGSDGKEKWIDFVNNHKLYDWVNAWNPYDYKFKEIYDVRSTPQIFVLNKNKEIIGKKIGAENVVDLINAYKQNNKQ